ncbi:MAG: hypothetical protein NVSMB25_20760 [Thermoleophilaceae bacterium]
MLTVALASAAALFAGLLVWRLVFVPFTRMKARLASERAQFEALAHEDPLTGLPNKRAFNDRLEAELRRAEREYYPVAIVVLDLDRFKQINDSWGHAVGDEALIALAAHIEAELRAGDICGRMGGDEFTIALVRADAQSADRVLARLRLALTSAKIGPAGESIHFSAGISEFPRHGSDRDTLVVAADSALYWGKANGRGRSTIFSPQTRGALTPADVEAAARQRGLMTTLQALAKAVDAKSRFMVGHSERVASYAVALAASFDLPDERIDALRQAALLHDVGKIGIPEAILVKEMPLNMQEAEELERHSELGRAMLSGAGMPEIARWVNHLHERFDGGGYPFGLVGREIPLESRILHAADALDWMTRPRAYRRYRPLREALAELSYGAGTRLDPVITMRLRALVESGKLRIDGHEIAVRGKRVLEQPARKRSSYACLE